MIAIASTKAEQDHLARLARRHSLTVMEIMTVIGEVIRTEFNTEHNHGKSEIVFTFIRDNVIGLDYFTHANVPEPDAAVDLFEARARCLTDAQYASALLDQDCSKDFARNVLANTFAWARFWAVRFPTPEGRAVYRAIVVDLDGGILSGSDD